MALNTRIRGLQLADEALGAGLQRNAVNANLLEVGVDDSSIGINGDALEIKALGVTLAMLEQTVQDDIALAHEHNNIALLETYTQTEVDLADAVALKHAQNTDTVLQVGAALAAPQQLIDDGDFYNSKLQGTFWWSQTFIADKTGTLDTIDLTVKRLADPVTTYGDLEFFIMPIVAGKPDHTAIMGTATVPKASIGLTPTAVQATLSGVNVVAGTSYAFGLRQQGDAGDGTYAYDISSAYNSPQGFYLDGSIFHNSAGAGGNWTEYTYEDFTFAVNITGTPGLIGSDLIANGVLQVDFSAGSNRITTLAAPTTAGDALRQTAVITEAALEAVIQADDALETDFVKSVQTMVGGETVLTSVSGYAPVVVNTVQVYLNGLLQEEGVGQDYVLTASTGVVTFGTAGGTVWAETQPLGDTNQNWGIHGDISNDGSTIIIRNGPGSGRLYLSTDSGANYSEIQPAGDIDKQWDALSVSGNGQVILAGNTQRMYLSTNGGSTFAETLPAGSAVDRIYYFSALSGDGAVMLCGIYGGQLYLSTNTGTTWAEINPAGAGVKDWYNGCVSDDGSTVIATIDYGATYLSTNSGSSFVPTFAIRDNWEHADIDVSADGSVIVAAVWGDKCYISTDGGTVYTALEPTGVVETKNWEHISVSNDGTAIFAGIQNAIGGRVYISTDSGVSFTEATPTGVAEDKPWQFARVSGDKSTYFTAVSGGRAYLGSVTSPSGALEVEDVVTIHAVLDN